MPPGETKRAVVSVIERGVARQAEARRSCRSPGRRCSAPDRRCARALRRRACERRGAASRAAVNRPAGPPPTMRTSIGSCIRGSIISGRVPYRLRPCGPRFSHVPRAGDPERQQDQLHVEPEAGALQVEPIEAELARARDVARRVDLRQPGQARAGRRGARRSRESDRAAPAGRRRALRLRRAAAAAGRRSSCRRRRCSTSCGSSSIAVARSSRPTRVTRGSFSVACTGPVSASASGTIDRNFSALEHAAAQADALLPEEHRAAVLELDRERESAARAAPRRAARRRRATQSKRA